MPASTQSYKSDSLKLYNDRIQGWMADGGLDIQGRLLAGSRSGVQPPSPRPSKKKSAKTEPKAHI
ncbi:hypothetical protein FVEN_g12862 [Fusarium venenatum]|uniref:Uncharacterized protein n=1 Tax=Fusarium venenatum TaxID=56646 RepID=A0A2L2TM41_9HYPO|nr:uncharacterized protein FVRRES_04701 [Fusarium venenatum]KAG8355664.1 hypothetical protein FVEN_g12862 [Fusarium venenatum]CEI60265.1 unnamed protein product [Fusarium venenatum]